MGKKERRLVVYQTDEWGGGWRSGLERVDYLRGVRSVVGVTWRISRRVGVEGGGWCGRRSRVRVEGRVGWLECWESVRGWGRERSGRGPGRLERRSLASVSCGGGWLLGGGGVSPSRGYFSINEIVCAEYGQNRVYITYMPLV